MTHAGLALANSLHPYHSSGDGGVAYATTSPISPLSKPSHRKRGQDRGLVLYHPAWTQYSQGLNLGSPTPCARSLTLSPSGAHVHAARELTAEPFSPPVLWAAWHGQGKQRVLRDTTAPSVLHPRFAGDKPCPQTLARKQAEAVQLVQELIPSSATGRA